MAVRCKVCGVSKPAADFYAHPKTANGLLPACKECHKDAVRRNRAAKAAYYRQYDLDRADLPHRSAARKEYQQTEAGRAAANLAKKNWSERNAVRKAASVIVNNAIKNGRLMPQPCWVCGKKAQAHHPDYDAPLAVAWLCPSHHALVHKQFRSYQPEK